MAYGEEAAWWNENMVPLGYEAMETLDYRKLENRFDSALQYVHGDWSQKYGIGETIKKALRAPNDAAILDECLGNLIGELKDSLRQLEGWQKELAVDSPADADNEDEDYDYDEDDE